MSTSRTWSPLTSYTSFRFLLHHHHVILNIEQRAGFQSPSQLWVTQMPILLCNSSSYFSLLVFAVSATSLGPSPPNVAHLVPEYPSRASLPLPRNTRRIAAAAVGLPAEHKLSDEVRQAGFEIEPDELASVTRDHDIKALRANGGVEGIARRVSVSLKMASTRAAYLTGKRFMGATVILKSLLRVFGFPADGIYISGYSLVIDESSLSGESEPVNIDEKNPFHLSGTKVQDGSGKMLVTAVGMKTEWGKLMETLNEGGEDETPLQVKLNGVATIIGKIGLAFAVLTFLVLTARFLVEKALHKEFTHWSSYDAFTLLDYFAIAVTIIVVAVPEGLPLAVTLSLAFAMKK
ncbi:hypothetical protein GH714_035448 [Hevea brasiliensis]|uniref:P-type ATPase A domain-containing protein n=1 Tax=Hevea brasiliensis TaxID=3981 RepID=A0A6A6KK84_HEVBR|nr:hypothetical protein GH714_035448 [Hevea brasiliensis]